MTWIGILGITLVVAALAYGAWLMFHKVRVSVPRGDDVPDAPRSKAAEADTPAQIRELLVAAGLSAGGRLGSLGVNEHLARLERGEVSKSMLEAYARDLRSIGEATESFGARVPASFWDVETKAFREAGWTCYKAGQRLGSEAGVPYLRVLAQCYARFLAFKRAEASGTDNAVDAALDMVAIVHAYVRSVPQRNLLQHAPEIDDEVHATVYGWQNVVAGTTRMNPLTKEPVFSHGFLDRFNVVAMWEHETGTRVGVARGWGLSGFAPRFVGTPKNNNQIEHMSISIVLQTVLARPAAMLDAIEDAKVAGSGAGRAEADADKALNDAVRRAFVARYRDDLPGAVEALRQTLHASSK